MSEISIKWIPADSVTTPSGWRVIGKPREDANGQLVVPIAPDDGNVYVAFDPPDNTIGVYYTVNWGALNKTVWMKHAQDETLKNLEPLRDSGVAQYHTFENMNIGDKEEFIYKNALNELRDKDRRQLYNGEFSDQDDESDE